MTTGLPECILIANRGEIACRIIRTLRDLGIRAACVYSDADAQAKHVRDADASAYIGESTAAASYLNVDAVIEAARALGADAIHPGYGFGAENPDFARAVIESGLKWIGPEPQLIAALGDKLAARDVFAAAGFPVGEVFGPVESVAEALKAARKMAGPIMVKLALGGGGIGMARVAGEDELAKAIEAASSYGQRFFGSDSVYLEQFLEGARHVEFQVVVDTSGNAVALYERECSIQRRRQKLIEETPSSTLPPSIVEEYGALAAATLAQLGYVGLATVETLVSADGSVSFLEVNTRLQVEHTITEMVTGIDLVALQVSLAAGNPLPFTDAPPRNGHAIECRITAEHPLTFRPSPGTINRLRLPRGVRCDFGYDEGDFVPPFYDSLVGKIVVHADTRESAIMRTQRALEELVVGGIETNRNLHLAVLTSDGFRSGCYDTEFLEKEALLLAT